MFKTMSGFFYGFALILCLGAWNSASAALVTYQDTTTGHYYAFTSGTMTWQAAEDEAAALGGHLTAVNTAEEQAFIYSLVDEVLGSNPPVWIGFTDKDSEGTWVWSNGDAVTYTNWHSGEPNNACGGTGEDFAALGYWAGSDKWNDTSDVAQGRYYYGVMEFETDPAATPIPAAAWLLGSGLVGLVGVRRKYQGR